MIDDRLWGQLLFATKCILHLIIISLIVLSQVGVTVSLQWLVTLLTDRSLGFIVGVGMMLFFFFSDRILFKAMNEKLLEKSEK